MPEGSRFADPVCAGRRDVQMLGKMGINGFEGPRRLRAVSGFCARTSFWRRTGIWGLAYASSATATYPCRANSPTKQSPNNPCCLRGHSSPPGQEQQCLCCNWPDWQSTARTTYLCL